MEKKLLQNDIFDKIDKIKIDELRKYYRNRIVKHVANIVYKIVKNCNFPIDWIIKNNLNFEKNLDLIKMFEGKRIAVVWNSPSINEGDFWEDIDRHDIVIRFNRWWYSENLTEYTWYKTNLWGIWNPKVLEVNDSLLSETPILLSHPLDLMLRNLSFLKLINQFWLNKKYKVNLEKYVNMVKLLSDDNEEFFPSVGFLTINTIVESDIFEKLSIYGFTFNTDHRIEWNNRGMVELHNFSKEKDIILAFVSGNSKISIY